LRKLWLLFLIGDKDHSGINAFLGPKYCRKISTLLFAAPVGYAIMKPMISKLRMVSFLKEGINLITNKQRNFLRASGHELSPIIFIGKSGVTDQVAKELELALTARELVKGRVLPHTEFEVRTVADELAVKTGAEIVQTVGCNILFYRPPAQGESKLNWPEEA
jgi:RNA-binding protein